MSYQTIHCQHIDEYEEIIRDECYRGQFKVTQIKVGDGLFKDMKKYVEQSFKLGDNHVDIDSNSIVTRQRHWVNFGIGPSGGTKNVISQHKYDVWRLRNDYDPDEIPRSHTTEEIDRRVRTSSSNCG